MQFTVERARLYSALKAVSFGLADKETHQQADCFVFTADELYTLNEQVCCHTANPVPGLIGAVANEQMLFLLRTSTSDELTLTVKGNRLTILDGDAGKHTYTFEPTTQLPINEVEKPTHWTSLPEGFWDAVRTVKSCASRKETHRELMCLRFLPNEIQALNDNQVCRSHIQTGIKQSRLILRNALEATLNCGMNEFCEGKDWLHFRNKEKVIHSLRSFGDENFPDDLPELFEQEGTELKLPHDLAALIERTGTVNDNNPTTKKVEVFLRENLVTIRGTGTKTEFEDSCSLVYSGEPISFRIHPQLLYDILARYDDGHTCTITKTILKIVAGPYEFITSLATQ